MGKRADSRHSQTPAARRAYGQSFLAGRAFGFNLGHVIGSEAGYDKGYAEGSTLGYNNGFLQALHLLEEGEGTAGEKATEALLCLLEKLAAAGAVTITLSGAGRQEAASLFTLLGMTVQVGEENGGQ
ncbi:MAG TPA: hypothetical protein VMW83_09680 [Spirochaetia bacterium]|nr:hypothetical protein [Spirochaetia bacterium]